MNHAPAKRAVDATEIHNSNVAYVNEKTAKTLPVRMLVETGGFSFPLMLGINAMMNNHEPIDITISCQTISMDCRKKFKRL